MGYFFQISWSSHNIWILCITRHFQFLQKNYRYVKGLISVSAMGEHCVLATNFEDNGGSISDSNYTLLLCNALGTPIDSKQVCILKWILFWKNSVDFWHRKLTLKVWFRHFLMNHNSLQGCFKTISFEHVDSWAKILHFATHHL